MTAQPRSASSETALFEPSLWRSEEQAELVFVGSECEVNGSSTASYMDSKHGCSD